jgi:hypothetical protein
MIGPSGRERTTIEPGAVTIVLTGNAAMKEALVQRAPRRVFRDSNRFSPADPAADGAWTHYSLDWDEWIAWNGRGELPVEESERLSCIVNRAHELGRRVRFYGAPDRPAVWRAWLAYGVDYLNTDELDGMREAARALSSTSSSP